ncbi:hypothetical protein G6F35_018664 [Rhizopus arrhizus]|nr:hypothetical protein G6F35_018664 [Rhizopus arrhizus]
MVEIAGLGMAVVGAGDVVHPGALGEGTELLALAVIEDVDAQFVRRPVGISTSTVGHCRTSAGSGAGRRRNGQATCT